MSKYFLICGILLTIALDIAQCKCTLNGKRTAKGWFIKHDVPATFEEAMQGCRNEGGKLVTLTTDKFVEIMHTLMDDNTAYYIDSVTTVNPKQFSSSAGDQLPASIKMTGSICLSVNGNNVNVVTCDAKLPYICFRESNESVVDCGTLDTAYKYNEVTGSCYKFHTERLYWGDAHSKCSAEGGHMVVLNNHKEKREVQRMLQEVRQRSNEDNVEIHIGHRLWEFNNSFLGVNGECTELVFTGYIGNIYKCGILNHEGIANNDGCDIYRRFVCEITPPVSDIKRCTCH